MFKFISTSTTGIKTTFGKFSGSVKPGLTFYIPFIQNINIVSNRLTQKEFIFEVKSKDNIFSQLKISVQYRIREENTEKAFYGLSDPIEQMKSYVEGVLRPYVSQLTLSELFEAQSGICETVANNLSKMEDYGYSIENTLLKEIEPNNKVKEALNNLETAKRHREAAKEEAEAEYIKAVKLAEADRDRKILQGAGIAGMRSTIINGYKDGIKEMSDNLGMSPNDTLHFILEMQRLDMMETVGKTSGTKTIFLEKDAPLVRKHILESE